MKTIVQKDTPAGKALRDIAKPVTKSEIKTPKFKALLKDMESALASQHDGVALAAPQLGVAKRLFVISPIIFSTSPNASTLVFINPTIVKKSNDKKKMEEGCLSVRGVYGVVRRSSRVTVEAMDAKGEIFQMNGAGLLAQIFQHEIDHLEGILFTDKGQDFHEIDMEVIKKRFAKKK